MSIESSGQKVLPAVRSLKDFDKFMKTAYDSFVVMDIHVVQLKGIQKIVKNSGKKMLLHADLIHGLKNDEYAAEFLCQDFRPAGLISTKSKVILKARQKGVLAIQRVFLLDSNALEKSYGLIGTTQPDYIEVLPGCIPHIIKEVRERTGKPVLAGGLIRSVDDVHNALDAGAAAITTSNTELWEQFEPQGKIK
ncbi:glycerol-3-phosphate responsive antiterminator [Ferviditalea candida]|uniref:Glycerol uptake operon antiterminator regulatory protein n=1 Tax=Ferviditalea candida TaxID=3108399 RepID=A0ABU5ZII4_9BACL|nr:glycerol-3-phosphate responsive antiterminator [Paenibacillaceae bacterium T2]